VPAGQSLHSREGASVSFVIFDHSAYFPAGQRHEVMLFPEPSYTACAGHAIFWFMSALKKKRAASVLLCTHVLYVDPVLAYPTAHVHVCVPSTSVQTLPL
jgi:hypothetical protein